MQALEQLAAEVFLKLPDLLADSRLGDAQALGLPG